MAKKKVNTEDIQDSGAYGVHAGGGIQSDKANPKRSRRICLTLSEELSQAIREGCAELGVSISSVVADMESDHWQRGTFQQLLAAEASRRMDSLKRFLPNTVVVVPVPFEHSSDGVDSSSGFGEES